MKELFIQNSTQSGFLKENRLVYAGKGGPDVQQTLAGPEVHPPAEGQTVDAGQFKNKVLYPKVKNDVNDTRRAGEEHAQKNSPERVTKMEEVNRTLNALKDKHLPSFDKIKTSATAMPTRDLEWTAKALQSIVDNPTAKNVDIVSTAIDKRLKENQSYAQKSTANGEAVAQAPAASDVGSRVSNLGVLPLLRQTEGAVADVLRPSTEKQEGGAAIASRKGRKTTK